MHDIDVKPAWVRIKRSKPLVNYHCSELLWFLTVLWQGLHNILTLHFCICAFNVLFESCITTVGSPGASLLHIHEVLPDVSLWFIWLLYYYSTEWILELKTLLPRMSPKLLFSFFSPFFKINGLIAWKHGKMGLWIQFLIAEVLKN